MMGDTPGVPTITPMPTHHFIPTRPVSPVATPVPGGVTDVGIAETQGSGGAGVLLVIVLALAVVAARFRR